MNWSDSAPATSASTARFRHTIPPNADIGSPANAF